ncbi:putative Golgi transport protein 1 [Gracilariopsis chorda]|uniref:Putative Golgi transport protein 1 n=1 Tax=Gracilariopsis chorda TaxID=448386 RepID=A0A2V3INQ2_9FLOR|nr:putative Golgi transport protein 1 [Gracilariopsis chorda]|eukprot:PXF43702.1 putative Golgi transport protein 1 [Gracilariopsis chorda]
MRLADYCEEVQGNGYAYDAWTRTTHEASNVACATFREQHILQRVAVNESSQLRHQRHCFAPPTNPVSIYLQVPVEPPPHPNGIITQMSSPFAITDVRKIGIGLTAFGLAFSVLGVALFFDKGLLAMGNVLYLAGVMMIIGPTRSVRFFFQKRKAKASVFFFTGMAVVLFGLPVLGMAVELFGFVNLFGDFFPVVIAFLRRAPVFGRLLGLPIVRNVADRLAGSSSKLPV